MHLCCSSSSLTTNSSSREASALACKPMSSSDTHIRKPGGEMSRIQSFTLRRFISFLISEITLACAASCAIIFSRLSTVAMSHARLQRRVTRAVALWDGFVRRTVRDPTLYWGGGPLRLVQVVAQWGRKNRPRIATRRLVGCRSTRWSRSMGR